MIWLCFLHGTAAHATNDSIKKTIVYDSSNVSTRELPAEKKKELTGNSDYKYDRVGPPPVSMWDRFKEWLWYKVEEIFNSKGGSIGFRIFEYLLIAAVIVAVILLLLRNNVRALFYGKSASVAIDFSEFKENIHGINFEELIAEALARNDFRRAIRLHFLKLLKELSDKKLISWQLDKTNNDYSIELAKSKYSSKFREIALLYEYIWYGDFQVDESSYGSMVLKFKDFRIP